MEKFVLEIRMSDDMRSLDDLACALHRVASKVQGGTGTGKIRDLTGDFTGEFDIVKVPDLLPGQTLVFTNVNEEDEPYGGPHTALEDALPELIEFPNDHIRVTLGPAEVTP